MYDICTLRSCLGLLGSSSQPIFGRFLALKMQNFLRGALPRTPLGLPAPDPRLGLRPRPRVRRCRRPEAELRLQAKVARCRLSSKKIAIEEGAGAILAPRHEADCLPPSRMLRPLPALGLRLALLAARSRPRSRGALLP